MTNRLCIALYAIARDEARHVERFTASIEDADHVVIADTGSSDETAHRLRERGAQVTETCIDPWRFDDARNTALALVPADVDVCISLDLDEVLQPGWRKALEATWTAGATRLRYPFVSSWNDDGTPGVTFRNNRVHARRGYRWRLPIHEILEWRGEGEEREVATEDFVVHHHPDEQKSRSSYLPLLCTAAAESPEDPRLSHYLGREYGFHQRHDEAIRELCRSLELPRNSWAPQRAEACRLIAKSCEQLGRLDEALHWAWRAVAEHPTQREPWVDLASALYHRGDYEGGYFAARRALSLATRSPDYFSEPHAWGSLPDDLAAICAWEIGLYDYARRHAVNAARLDPANERLQRNVELMAACSPDASGPHGERSRERV
ncbi:MAG: glycosyl transferase family 2 [Planctomycetota bacterium]|nr:MAG: glycosyl transferase family 2 [Planctomycetota bacterium]REK24108.1 MAG: glycosyl transferase family 2 [Planctomycetota bacterium]REK38314.1 MAG: glycosyl transferase family 2 [Planctomycetota bacterium]